jgi:hypothetical protein
MLGTGRLVQYPEKPRSLKSNAKLADGLNPPLTALIHVTDVDVIRVQLELVGGQYPALQAAVSQGFSPSGRSYYLIRPPPRWNAGEDLAYLQDARCSGVAFDRLAVNPPHVSSPAEVVGIGQTTGPAVALGYAWAVRDAGQEVVTRFEGLDTDSVPFGQDSERCYETLIDNPSLQIAHRLWSRPEVRALQKLTRLSAIRPGVLIPQGTETPYSTAYARWARRGEIHLLQTPTSGEQCGAKE